MLTQIEWWGGLLIIWLCVSFRLLWTAFQERGKLATDAVFSLIAFLCLVTVFALYIYTIENVVLQRV